MFHKCIFWGFVIEILDIPDQRADRGLQIIREDRISEKYKYETFKNYMRADMANVTSTTSPLM